MMRLLILVAWAALCAQLATCRHVEKDGRIEQVEKVKRDILDGEKKILQVGFFAYYCKLRTVRLPMKNYNATAVAFE